MSYEKQHKWYIINKRSLAAALLYAPFVQPAFLQRYTLINSIFNYSKITALGILLYLVLFRIFKYKRTISIVGVFALVFELSLVLSTLINDGEIIDVLNYTVPIILFSILIDNLNGLEAVLYLKGLSALFFLICFINFFTLLIFPQGLYQGETATEIYTFLGHDNSTLRILLPGIVYSGVHDYLVCGKLKTRTILMVLMTMVTVTLTWSNTAMIGCGIILVFLVFFRKYVVDFLFREKIISYLPIILFLMVVVFQFANIYVSQIAEFFGKNANLTGRTDIWSYGLLVIKEKIWFGNGYGAALPTIRDWIYEPSSFHNIVLDLLFRGGIVHTCIFFALVRLFCHKLMQEHTIVNQFLLFILLSYYVMWQVEPFLSTGILGMTIFFIICGKVNEWNYEIIESNK